MATQQWIVFTVVLGCGLYAAWVLMPAVARRALAKGLVQLPLGGRLKSVFQRATVVSAGCDCSGCDKVVDRQRKPQQAVQVVRFHPKRRD
jgi:hypothetical protein